MGEEKDSAPGRINVVILVDDDLDDGRIALIAATGLSCSVYHDILWLKDEVGDCILHPSLASGPFTCEFKSANGNMYLASGVIDDEIIDYPKFRLFLSDIVLTPIA